MIEDDGKHDLLNQEDDDRYAEGLVYDQGKFLTTLSLLAVGGVLTIADSADKADIKPTALIIVTCVLFLAAVLAASTASTIAFDRFSGKPLKRYLHYYILATVALLGMGLGMFIFMWVDKLN